MSNFEYRVKERLLFLKKTQSWLIDEIKKRHDCFLDSAYISKIISGKRNAPEIKKLICEILDIEDTAKK